MIPRAQAHEPRERPILFSGPLVRAILNGTKTQTRRIVRWEYEHGFTGRRPLDRARGDADRVTFSEPYTRSRGEQVWFYSWGNARWLRSPYGRPGDRLWVREAWGALEADRPGVPGGRRPQPGDDIRYRADDADAWQWRDGSLPWRPSIHMPRWASRILLGVTTVRVERLQSITEDDAHAEGCTGIDPEPATEGGTVYAWKGRSSAPSARAHFVALWDRINAKRGYSWASNPWVWVIEFRRVHP